MGLNISSVILVLYTIQKNFWATKGDSFLCAELDFPMAFLLTFYISRVRVNVGYFLKAILSNKKTSSFNSWRSGSLLRWQYEQRILYFSIDRTLNALRFH